MSRNQNQNRSKNPTEVLNGSSTLPAQVELAEGKSVTLGDVVRHAFAASGLSVEDWNKQDPAKVHELLQASIETMKADPDAAIAAAAAAASSENQPPPPPKAKAKVKARVLSSFTHDDERREPNDLVELTAADAEALAGYIDTTAAAVAYAEARQGGAGGWSPCAWARSPPRQSRPSTWQRPARTSRFSAVPTTPS